MHVSLSELLREQAGLICAQTGHVSEGFVLPLQTWADTREALCACRTCGRERWIQLEPDEFARLLADNTSGKLVSEHPAREE